MMYPLVRELAVEGIPVVVTCRVLGFSKQAFYKWRKSPVSQRDWDDANLVDAAHDVHRDDPVFGYRFICDELRAEHGISTSENRVHRLCKAHGIYSVLAKKKGRWARPKEPVHGDLVQRAFGARAANELWFVDITEHPTAEGKLYLCAIKDAFSGRIVGYSMDSRMKASFAVAAFKNAIAPRGPVGTIVHSDRGSQPGFKGSSHCSIETGSSSPCPGPASVGTTRSRRASSRRSSASSFTGTGGQRALALAEPSSSSSRAGTTSTGCIHHLGTCHQQITKGDAEDWRS